MYNIHGLCIGHYVLLVFMVLPGKSESIGKGNILTLEPTTVNIDFEVTMYAVPKKARCISKTSYN